MIKLGVSVGVAYGASMDQTREVLEKVPGAVTGVLSEPASQIVLVNLGASSVDWKVRVWCKTGDYWDVLERTTRATKLALDEAGIAIPFPQLDVHLDK